MPGQADDSMLSGADFITWRRARLPWLGPELSIVLVKVLHQFLAIQERLARTNHAGGLCKMAGCGGEER